MEQKQIISAFATAKVLGYDGSFDSFKDEYQQYYSQTLNEINLRPVEPAKAEATQNPFRSR